MLPVGPCLQEDQGRRRHVTSPGPPTPAAFPSNPSSPAAVENNRHHLKQWEGRVGTGCRHLKKLLAIGVTPEGRGESCWLGVLLARFPTKNWGCASQLITWASAKPHAAGPPRGLIPSHPGQPLSQAAVSCTFGFQSGGRKEK